MDMQTEAEQQTIETAIWGLWQRCLATCRTAACMAEAFGGPAPMAGAVQGLIEQSRSIIADAGYSRQDSDQILAQIYTRIHWDWDQPSDRIFEALLDIELAEFFKERLAH